MNVKNLLCLVAAVALVTSTGASAQSLSELAKAEKQRRAKLQKAGGAAKVYTEGDRSGGAADTTTTEAAPAATSTGATGAPGAKTKEKTPEELAADKQKEWANKVKGAQDQITELETSIQQNERNLASMINITPARADLASRVEADKKKLADLKQSLVSLEDERRRAGMPRAR